MTQEQKARAYDEAIERAREVIKNNPDFVRVTPQLMEEIFPELAEAEDSRISKEICDFICWATDRCCITKEQVEKSNSWLAWLGKQGEQKPAELPKGEDYGIDGLWHAISILQRTLGEVEGYQSDDGILEHKCAISAVKELYERKPAWSEEDEKMLNDILMCGERHCYLDAGNIAWLKSLKDRVQPQPKQEWSEKYIADVFEKVGLAKIAREQGYDALTEAIQSAMIELSKFTPQPKQEWNEEDEKRTANILSVLNVQVCWEKMNPYQKEIDWLKSLQVRIGRL